MLLTKKHVILSIPRIKRRRRILPRQHEALGQSFLHGKILRRRSG
ncbi:hypothetical protein [Hymenobacter gelipurpurascens]|nr:hypothetical protein [Hymenobacter gelipurpurascens]